MANEWLSPERIKAKKIRGEALTPWERSVYRLNYRPDGSRYSDDPKVRAEQYEYDNGLERRVR